MNIKCCLTLEMLNLLQAELVCSFPVLYNLSSATRPPPPLRGLAAENKSIITPVATSMLTCCQISATHQRLTCSCSTSAHRFCGSNNSSYSPVAVPASQLSTALRRGLQSSSHPKPPTETKLHINLTQILRRATSCGAEAAFPVGR